MATDVLFGIALGLAFALAGGFVVYLFRFPLPTRSSYHGYTWPRLPANGGDTLVTSLPEPSRRGRLDG